MRMSDWSSDVCASDLPLVGGGFIAQSFRRAYEFEVSAPWGLHVHPGIALGRMPLDVVRLDFAEDPYVPALQVFDGSRKVVDIQREMRGAIIAVFGLFLALVRSIEFEEFKIGSIPAPDPLGYRCRSEEP